MHIYFYTTNSSIEYPLNIAVMSSLQKMGAAMYSNIEGLSNALELPKDLDGVVALAGNVEKDLSYVVALGVARSKPLLLLFPKGMTVPEDIAKLCESSEVKKLITIEYVTARTMPKKIQHFVERQVIAADSFVIKFTLRLNNKLDRFLDRKSKTLHMSKADFVRKLFEECQGREVLRRNV